MELDCLTTKVFYFDFFFYVNYVVDGYCDRIVDILEILWFLYFFNEVILLKLRKRDVKKECGMIVNNVLD